MRRVTRATAARKLAHIQWLSNRGNSKFKGSKYDYKRNQKAAKPDGRDPNALKNAQNPGQTKSNLYRKLKRKYRNWKQQQEKELEIMEEHTNTDEQLFEAEEQRRKEQNEKQEKERQQEEEEDKKEQL